MTSSTVVSVDHQMCNCEDSVEAWYEDFRDVIWQFVYSRVGDITGADDCTSETFLRALTGRHRFRCQGFGVRPWLFTIARNVVHDYCRRLSTRRENLTDSTIEISEAITDPARQVMSLEIRYGIEQCVNNLPPDQEKCFRLRFMEELSVTETAERMHRTNRAIRALQYRARRKVVAMLIDHGLGIVEGQGAPSEAA